MRALARLRDRGICRVWMKRRSILGAAPSHAHEPSLSRRHSRRPAMTTVGLVGLGLLGHAVAARLLAAGHTVIGFDVLAERSQALADIGGETARSAAAIAQASD